MTRSYLDLPSRLSKPRERGITAVHDVGVPIGELQHILEDFHPFIDVAKFGVGSAYPMPRLRQKIELYQKYDVHVYFGGTLFEKSHYQNKLDDYVAFMKDLGVDWVEVSNGTVDIDLDERVRIVEKLSKDFTVLSEVGCKDTEVIISPRQWIHELNALLDANCRYVIAEGRDSGTAGVFRPSGEIRTGLVTDISAEVDTARIIFEAPRPKSQMFFINMIGPDVNLGNVNPRDLLLLESQRLGLRNETFFLGQEEQK